MDNTRLWKIGFEYVHSCDFEVRVSWRRTDDYTKDTPKVKLVTEDIPLPLHPIAVLIKIHAVALNYRDANIANGAGEVVSVGNIVSLVSVGDRVAPITDSEFVNARSTGRSWLAANEDGLLATYIVFDKNLVTKFPDYLDWIQASIIPCAGTTAWSALKGTTISQTVLIQGTRGVSTFALKLARASSPRVILTSSSDEKLEQIKKQFGKPEIQTETLRLTNGIGVDLVIENGGSSSLVRSMECTRRGGIVSQVGYLGGPKTEHLKEFVSKDDQDELIAAISATQMTFEDILDSTWSFDKAEEAIEYLDR
ncbi:hypothetical protein DER45DRAFT_586219 [Fusarium avenaceum]|nr:hypothetical protein DER45DRAFT_586219 [Fusarium avenaceum]